MRRSMIGALALVVYLAPPVGATYPARANVPEDHRRAAERAEVCVQRGDAWFAEGEDDKAIASYTAAIKLAPGHATAYYNRGFSWHTKGEYDKALADYTAALELDPKRPEVFFDRGFVWYTKREYDKAIADFTAALKLDPKFANIHVCRGHAWSAKKEYDKAITDYRRAAELDPNAAEAHLALARIYTACPDPQYRDGKKAIEAAKKAVKISGTGRHRAALAAAHAAAGDFDAAVAEQLNVLEDVLLSAAERKFMEELLARYRDKKPLDKE